MSTASSPRSLTVKATFASLLAQGYWPIPIKAPGEPLAKAGEVSKGKEPIGAGWGKEKWSLDRGHAELSKVKGRGLGVCLGPGRAPDGGWLIDIEGDGPEAEQSRLILFDGEEVDTRGWVSARGFHQWFTVVASRISDLLPLLKGLEKKGGEGGVYKSPLLPGLEIRIGGYNAKGEVKQVQSVVPPTPGTDGSPRRWVGPEGWPVPAPEAFYQTLQGLAEVAAREAAEKKERRSRPAAPLPAPSPRGKDADRLAKMVENYCLNALAGEAEKLAGTPEGRRRFAMLDATMNCAGLVRAGGLAEVSFRHAMGEAARLCGLDPEEAEPLIQSALDKAEPRDLTGARQWAIEKIAEWDAEKARDRAGKGGPPNLRIVGGGQGGDDGDGNPADGDGRPFVPLEEDDDPHRLARIFLDLHCQHADGTTLAFHNGEFLRWDLAYKTMPDKVIRAELNRAIKQEFDRLNLDALRIHRESGTTKPPPKSRRVSSALTNNVHLALSGYSLLPCSVEAPAWLCEGAPWPAHEILPARNGLVHLPSFADGKSAVIPPSPTYFCPYVMDYAFEPKAPTPEVWFAFLRELWPDDPQAVATLQEWFGYHLTPDMSQQKIGMIIGPPRCGKGTIIRILTALMGGVANVCNPTLTQLGTPFGQAVLIGKLAAIITDARITGRADISQIVELLLSISGEDNKTIPRKHVDDWSGKIMTKFTIISNETPRLADSSGALPKRMIIFQLTKSFLGNEDTGLMKKLLPELPGILIWAIAGWKRLQERGHFIQPDFGKALVEEMEQLSSPIGMFVKEKCVVGPNESVDCHELFAQWLEWCKKINKQYAGDLPQFGKELRSIIPTLETKPYRKHVDGKTEWGRKFHGLAQDDPSFF